MNSNEPTCCDCRNPIFGEPFSVTTENETKSRCAGCHYGREVNRLWDVIRNHRAALAQIDSACDSEYLGVTSVAEAGSYVAHGDDQVVIARVRETMARLTRERGLREDVAVSSLLAERDREREIESLLGVIERASDKLEACLGDQSDRVGIEERVGIKESFEDNLAAALKALEEKKDVERRYTELRTHMQQVDAIPMLLWCPLCGERHIDVGEFATKPHHTHACQHCGACWRPAVVATCGVQFLPGFKNAG